MHRIHNENDDDEKDFIQVHTRVRFVHLRNVERLEQVSIMIKQYHDDDNQIETPCTFCFQRSLLPLGVGMDQKLKHVS